MGLGQTPPMSLCDETDIQSIASETLSARRCQIAIERARPRYEDALIREQMEYYRVRAPEYDVTSAPPIDQLAAHARRIEMGLDQFRPMGRVLEIACGTGLWTIHLLRHASNITALDSSSEMHELSRIKTGGSSSSLRSGRCVHVATDGRYEFVFFADWLSHVPPGSFHRFWATVRAALAPAGRVFFVDELDDAWKYGHPFSRDIRQRPVGAGCVPVCERRSNVSGGQGLLEH
jgi:2-polyprenyl-3-methyl-5-hydroxy-6-metoxy-1,4-benzoquinol methylase